MSNFDYIENYEDDPDKPTLTDEERQQYNRYKKLYYNDMKKSKKDYTFPAWLAKYKQENKK